MRQCFVKEKLIGRRTLEKNAFFFSTENSFFSGIVDKLGSYFQRVA